MTLNNVWMDWLSEAEEPIAKQAPVSNDPAMVVGGGEQQPTQNEPQDDVENDPEEPEQEEEETPSDFEQWRHEFIKLSVKSDVKEMLNYVNYAKQMQGLESSQKKFRDDNFQILLYRQDANIANSTKQIRNLIRQDLDRTNPGTTIMQHLVAVLEKDQVLLQIPIKLSGLGGMKGDLHRKWITSLLGAIQIGGGSDRPDILYTDKDYTVNISTRFYTQFGEINLGKWSLKTDDPKRYLSEPEMNRLQEGSPEEKQVLRRRIIMESIGEKFKQRAFIINIVTEDNTIFSLGWDLGDSLLSAYKEGKVVVRGRQNNEKDAMISDTGEIVNLIDYDILYVIETGETDDNGSPEMIEVPFMQRRDSSLYLTADVQTILASSAVLSGVFFHETPYNGNPSDDLRSCVPSIGEILNRRC